MNKMIPIPRLLELHDQLVMADISSEEVLGLSDGVWQFIEVNHRCNQMLWHEEDLARRNDVEPREIMINKRAIDQFNQKRNDAIENINDEILLMLKDVKLNKNAKLNSETAGSIIDRLSILSLKIKATSDQAERKDVTDEHITICTSRLAILVLQRQDLASCLDHLISNFLLGNEYFKIYKQFKMYNDPKFNTHIKSTTT
jgi:Protein of unknown function (DUF4254)